MAYSAINVGYDLQEQIDGKADKTGTVLLSTLSRGRKSGTNRGDNSFAFGEDVSATATNAHAEGKNTTASGYHSHAEGEDGTASHDCAHAEGKGTTASGQHSHAEGKDTTASGKKSHAEGDTTTASGESSHAEGLETVVSGVASHAEGHGTEAQGWYQHVGGTYNVPDQSSLEIIGNGGSSSVKSNARLLDTSGNERLHGDVYVNCGDDSTGGSALGAGLASANTAITKLGTFKTLGTFSTQAGLITALDTEIGTMSNYTQEAVRFTFSAEDGRFSAQYYLGTLSRGSAADYCSMLVQTYSNKSDPHCVIGTKNGTWGFDRTDIYQHGLKLPTNISLDDYKTPGKYYCYTAAEASTITNSPFSVAYGLVVEINGYGFIHQTAKKAAGLETKERYYNEAVTPAVWTDWKTYAFTSDITFTSLGSYSSSGIDPDDYFTHSGQLHCYIPAAKSPSGSNEYGFLLAFVADTNNGAQIFIGGSKVYARRKNNGTIGSWMALN